MGSSNCIIFSVLEWPCVSGLCAPSNPCPTLIYLDVEDIMSLRSVNKLYYNLTHQGIIWKRFLRRIGPNAPQLPPSSRYSPRFLTSFEAERLVVRAITLDMNWVSSHPSTLSANRGKYMVASVSNWAKNFYSLCIFALDHRVGGIVALAETPVKQKAYNLRAKYMTIDGNPSIVIAYVRRKKILPVYHEIRNNPRLKIDPPVPFQYVCSCVQVSLDALDALADPRLDPYSPEFFEFARSQPPPFRLLSVLRSSSEFGMIDLAIIDDIPTLAVVKGLETIVFKQLTGMGQITTMVCAREEMNSALIYRICNVRILPYQGEILVIRVITDMTPTATTDMRGPPAKPPGLLTVAMFPIPAAGDSQTPNHTSISLVSFRADDAEDIQISDLHDYDLLGGESSSDPVVAPPINIFYRKSRCRLRYITLKPVSHQDRTTPYKIPFLTTTSRYSAKNTHGTVHAGCSSVQAPTAHLCTASHRKTVPDTPGVNSIYSHLVDPHLVDEYSGILREGYERRFQVLAKFDLCTDLYDDLRRGVKAMAWDESIGRIFYVKPDDAHIHVVDLAYAPSQTADGQRCPLPLADQRMLEL
ncbi:hypothetical protein EDD15DRAFT_2408703 [Pisolithus albus]|nr:hypothetical protein EDD15DRAFT_2408703 [Pisolithus albus]